MNPRPSTGTRVLPVVRRPLLVLLLTAMAAAMLGFVADQARAADPCATPVVSQVACENTKTGTTAWDITQDTSIEGFTTDISTNVGGTVNFKVRTASPNYRIDIYRLGWYAGDGGRLVGSVNPSVPLPQTQPDCLRAAATGEVDCGNWAVSASWAVPATAVSGVYSAVLRRLDTNVANNIVFVVRNDASHSGMVVQTSDTTWQAYNAWGGTNLYSGGGPGGNGRAYKVSYNRPLDPGAMTGQVMYAEYPMIRFLESNGYDVSYIAGVDTDRGGALLTNHRVFVSSGHDEYWSGAQRANVTSAKNAGVNLAFFSGNEMWWRVRWEPAIDGSGQGYRTLVCYKESLDGARTDPSGDWTGTWRDPRFSPAGVQPENALTGQLFRVNGEYGRRHDSLVVPGDLAGSFLWRNTAVASTAAGTTYTFPQGTLGYEWDTQGDNGVQPAGVADLSDSTVQIAEADVLQDDYGINYAPGTATHHLTMYRDPTSHAFVFAAGTVQWSWGLDDEHTSYGNPVTAANTPMRQATVNLLAQMGVQPVTLQSGLVKGTASTDTTAPTVSISSPAAGATVTVGTTVTVSGSAADNGGVVAGVEVSVDGGQTWHLAQGRTSWSYSFMPKASGPLSIQVRAVDDSANLSGPVSRSATVQARTCPCNIWPAATQPTNTTLNNDGTALELGTRFQSSVAGYVTGVRFYKGTGQTGSNTGSLWSAAGQQLATGTFTNETASGWQTLTFATPVAVSANTPYVVSYYSPTGQYVADNGYFSTSSYADEPLTALVSSPTSGNGLFLSGASGFPTATYGDSNYWVDVVFQQTQPADTTPPTATPGKPLPGSSSVAPTTPVTVTFNEAVQSGTIALSVTAAGASSPVAGTLTYDSGTQTATFQPASALAPGTKYTATLSAAKDLAGNALAAPVTWSFTTMTAPSTPGTCPCSVWDDTAVPAISGIVDAAAVELGMKFTASVDGSVTGVRFYKDARNTGAHTGTLWSSTGQQLATATFGAESTAGWQQVSFSTPVHVTAGTTYVVSYHTDAGYYSYTSQGLDNGVTKGPLTALPAAQAGGNGVFRYGTHSFPTTSGNANYWVDLVYTPDADTTAPTVTATAPSAGATAVPTTGPVSVTFSEPVSPATVSITVGSGSATVRGTTTYDAATRTATFSPSAPMAGTTTYTVTVSGAADAAGNVMSTMTFTFTTAAAGACPCTVFGGGIPATPSAADPSPVELGMRFSSDKSGWITGVRFFKAADNTGTHTGSLWAADGTQLATGTFVNETASGWQQLQFAAPVAVTAGTSYVVSYHTAGGHYSADSGYFLSSAVDNAPLHAPADTAGAPNGVYAYGGGTLFPSKTWKSTNYWVDVTFSATAPTDTVPPVVAGTSPAQGLSGVAVGTPIEFDMNEAVTSSSAVITVTAGGTAVGGSVSAPTANTLVFTPSSALPAGTSVSAVLSSVSDTAGNRLSSPYTLNFTTAAADPSQCPCTLFGPTATPAVASAADTDAVELGVRFTSDQAGYVSGVRFYKGTGNTGTHTGSLWSANGTRLATATFTAEGASGWQQVQFAAPVAVTAGTAYVASYHTDAGRYAYTYSGFAGTSVDRGPLHAPAATGTEPNGVYVYGASAFPSLGGTTNYWVDVVFSTAPPAAQTPAAQPPADTTAPTVASTSPSAAATAVPVTSTVGATFSEPVSSTSLAMTLTGPTGAVAGSVALDGTGTKATFTPAQPLAGQTTYTASARATDVAGNAMAAPVTWTFTTVDVTPPTLTATTPVTGATGVAPTAPITATFSEPIAPSGVTATIKAGATSAAGTLSWSADARTVTVTPAAALAYATSYTVTLTGIRDAAGNAIASAPAWSFTTAAAPTATLFTASDTPPAASVTSTTAAELGTRMTFTQAGWVTGIRFYKGTGATGTHVGSLWTASGQRLAAVQFTAETATGWQLAQLAQPVSVTPGTTYVVSYSAPAGRWSQTASYFTQAKTTGPITAPMSTAQAGNGLAGTSGSFPSISGSGANFWVDAVFTAVPPAGSSADTVAPVVVSTAPTGSGQSSQPAISALFSEQVTGVTMTLTDPSGAVVPSSLSWSAATLTETLKPVNALARSTTYTVRVSAAKDAAGNALAAPVSWTFTTA